MNWFNLFFAVVNVYLAYRNWLGARQNVENAKRIRRAAGR